MRWLLVFSLLAFPMRGVAEFVDVQEQAVKPADGLSRAFRELESVLKKLERTLDENDRQWRELDSTIESLNRKLQQ